MQKKTEILTDIRGKLQTSSLVVERMAEGKSTPESFINLAKKDFAEVEKLLGTLEK